MPESKKNPLDPSLMELWMLIFCSSSRKTHELGRTTSLDSGSIRERLNLTVSHLHYNQHSWEPQRKLSRSPLQCISREKSYQQHFVLCLVTTKFKDFSFLEGNAVVFPWLPLITRGNTMEKYFNILRGRGFQTRVLVWVKPSINNEDKIEKFLDPWFYLKKKILYTVGMKFREEIFQTWKQAERESYIIKKPASHNIKYKEKYLFELPWQVCGE